MVYSKSNTNHCNDNAHPFYPMSGTHIGHLNVYHLPNKIADISLLLNKTPKIHILGLSETWLNSKHNDDILSIPNYQILRRDTEQQGHTGLVAYIHNSVYPFIKRRTDLETSKIECMWIEIKCSMSSPLLLGYVYRHPDSTDEWQENFVQMMDTITPSNRNILLQGDFNVNLLEPHPSWQSTLTLFGLKQIVTKPTRISLTTTSLLDHIYTNNTSLFTNVEVPEKSISDHFPTICTWKTKPPKPPKKGHMTIAYRAFKNFQKEAFFQDLNSVPFSNIFNISDPNEALDDFYKTILPVINKHAPLRKKRVKSAVLPGWLTPEISVAQKHRDQLKTKLKQLYKNNIDLLPDPVKSQKLSDREQAAQEYRKQRNKVTSLIRASQKSYFSKMISDNKDTASLWKGINRITNKSCSKSCSNYAWSPDSFNDHFLHLAESTLDQTLSCTTYEIPTTLHNFCRLKLTSNTSFEIPLLAVHEVGALISNLRNKKSMGPDKISPSLLKLSLPYVVEPLTHIYNLCITQSTVPTALKTAQVLPLPKSKDHSNLNNFRPISLISTLSKPLERHIHRHLMAYLETHKLFYPLQSGFRPHHSCQSALIYLCDAWLSAVNQQKLTGAVFLDLTKAFDLVSHDILAKKLSLYLRNEASLSFFESYFENRSQFVLTNGKFSSTEIVKRGVPQGSVLGPLLFCIFINDLPLSISDPNLSCHIFADDTTLHSSAKNISEVESSLQCGLNDISNWCISNQMVIHPHKTKCMVITSRQKHQLKPLTLKLLVDNTPLEQVHSHKVLGVIIDDELRWENHIDFVTKKLARGLYLLNRLKIYIDSDARKVFFNAHCLSHINYASTVWGCSAQNHLKKLNILYKRGAKIILPDQTLSTLEKQAVLDILPLNKQLEFQKLMSVFKTRFNLAPDHVTNLLIKSYRYNSTNYLLPPARIDLFKTSFSFSGAVLWNSLPLDLKLSCSCSSFKTKLRQYLQSTSF